MAIPAETFFLEPNSELTLQQQLQRIVVEAILSGRCLPGEKMPSTRRLAEYLGIARITVTLAFTELVSNEYLVSRGRSGYYVAQTAPTPPQFTLERPTDEKQIDWSRIIGQRYTQDDAIVRPTNWRDYRFPFIYGQSDPKLFDHHNWRGCSLKAVGKKDFDTLATDYYERDDPMLVDNILSKILPRRGISATPDEILITMGAQNALWITAQILLNQRRTAVVENPCYPGLLQILKQTRCNMISVDVDDQGLPPDNIPESTDLIFTTPSHHCPTNATLPLDRRRTLLERAARDGFVIVEDDYEFELSFLGSPSPALKSLDRVGAVIHIGSFSKSLFPGLRLGYIVASAPFIHEARALRSLVLRHPPGAIQRTAAYFLAEGYYDAQVARIARTYARRRTIMEESLLENKLLVPSHNTFGGSSYWMTLPDQRDSTILADKLRSDGVLIEPGHPFLTTGQKQTSHYRLAYSSINSARIPEGISLLAKAIEAMK